MEDVEVDTTPRKTGEHIHPIVNTERVGKEDIDNVYQRRRFRREDNKTGQRKRFTNNNPRNTKDRRYQLSFQDINSHTRYCKYDAYDYSARYLHKLLNDLHTGDLKKVSLRGT